MIEKAELASHVQNGVVSFRHVQPLRVYPQIGIVSRRQACRIPVSCVFPIHFQSSDPTRTVEYCLFGQFLPGCPFWRVLRQYRVPGQYWNAFSSPTGV